MRKKKQQVKLNRSASHRRALMRNLSQELIRHGKITTTLAKARAVRPFVEPLITTARKEKAHAERMLAKEIYDIEIIRKLVDEIGPTYEKEQRPGGYTRIIKIGARRGDGAEQAIIELVSADDKPKKESKN